MENKLKYQKVLQDSFNKGFINKKKYLMELKWIREFGKVKPTYINYQ